MSLVNDTTQLLSRGEFRKAVLARDGYKCVICGAIGLDHPDKIQAYKDYPKYLVGTATQAGWMGVRLDAHHIMERRLWDDGGYYLDNGATLCDNKEGDIGCHLKAEQTTLSCEQIRNAANISTVVIPNHLYFDSNYDKWGNIINPDGTRIKGELFWDESVQTVLSDGGVLPLFRNRVKYPRTFHLPNSPGIHKDDRMLKSTEVFQGKEVVITEKMDGECSTLYSDYYHARSIDSGPHPSRGWIKNLHATIAYNIPAGWRICGENLYALHSVKYASLSTYFMVYSIWDENNICLSWDDTLEYTSLLGLLPVPQLYRGPWDESVIEKIIKTMNFETSEGFVVRIAESFSYGAFRRSIAKYVRPGHVQTTHNWMMREVVKNGVDINNNM